MKTLKVCIWICGIVAVISIFFSIGIAIWNPSYSHFDTGKLLQVCDIVSSCCLSLGILLFSIVTNESTRLNNNANLADGYLYKMHSEGLFHSAYLAKKETQLEQSEELREFVHTFDDNAWHIARIYPQVKRLVVWKTYREDVNKLVQTIWNNNTFFEFDKDKFEDKFSFECAELLVAIGQIVYRTESARSDHSTK